LRGVRREELAEGFGGGDGAVVFDMNIEVESGVCARNDTGIVEPPLLFCSFIAGAAAATLPSTDEDSGGGTLLLS
jgi:hypothetical protein